MNIQKEKLVGEIAAEFPQSIPLFRAKGIDYCCGGRVRLEQACAEAGVPLDLMVRDLEKATAVGGAVPNEWPSLSALIDHILKSHHVYTREQLYLLEGLSEKVLRVHGDRHLLFPFEVFQSQPQHCLMQDHETTGGQLVELQELTNGYNPPPGACVTYRAFYKAIADLEADIHQHIHLENNVLFPMAERLARKPVHR
jgi:regulator of cell morphogenesis and NO signaling